MELRELLAALQREMTEAGVSEHDSSVSLAFSAKKQRDGDVLIEFVDAGAMSKPRAEELHRLELDLSEVSAPDSVFEIVEVAEEKKRKEQKDDGDNLGLFKENNRLDPPPAFRQTTKPPALPEKKWPGEGR